MDNSGNDMTPSHQITGIRRDNAGFRERKGDTLNSSRFDNPFGEHQAASSQQVYSHRPNTNFSNKPGRSTRGQRGGSWRSGHTWRGGQDRRGGDVYNEKSRRRFTQQSGRHPIDNHGSHTSFNIRDYILPQMIQNPWRKLEEKHGDNITMTSFRSKLTTTSNITVATKGDEDNETKVWSGSLAEESNH